MIRQIKWIPVLVLLTLLASTVACKEQTYVLVTVDVDPSITEPITELRFDSLVTDGVSIFNEDSQRFEADGKPIKLPQSFVVLANGWGKNGETVGMAVEAYSADGTTVARARGQAIIIEGRESSEQVLLRAPCSEVTECLGGQAFCDNPHRCNCEGEDCQAGFCDPISKDDGNVCTEFACDDNTQSASNTPVGDGNLCGTAESGAEQFCGQGLCKEPACGDFVIDIITGEECDEGPENSDTAPGACRTSCKVPSCGDGVVDNVPAFGVVYNEECDEGAANVVVEDGMSNEATLGNACRQSVTLEDGSGAVLGCVLPTCGDGVLNDDERCDDHDSVNGDGCNPTCTMFGDVSIIAGAAGGPGDVDGVGTDSLVRELAGVALVGDIAYFTSGGLAPPQVIRSVSLADTSVVTVAGVVGDTGHADGIGAEVRLSSPTGMDAIGNTVIFADTFNQRIKTLDAATGQVSTIAGTGIQGSTDGLIGAASMRQPKLVAARSATDILFVESNGSCRLRQIDLTAGSIATLAGGASCPFPFGAQIGTIRGMVAADDGSVYVSEANLIRRITFAPFAITTVAGGGTFGEQAGNADGDGPVARFSAPGLLAIDGADLYVADLGNAVVRHIDLSANPVAVTTLPIGIPVGGITALAVRGTTLLMGQQDDSVILTGTLGTNPIVMTAIAGRPDNSGFVDDDGADAIIDSRFDQPHDLALVADQPGFLYVADSLNRVIRTVQLDLNMPKVDVFGSVDPTLRATNLVGSLTTLFATFGDTAQPELRELNATTGAPTGLAPITLDMPFNRGVALIEPYLYIADPENENIVRVDRTNGSRAVFAGSSGSDEAIVDGPVSVARFGRPHGLVACGGNLYVAESAGNFEAHVIRKIDLAADPAIVSTVAGFPTADGHVDGVGLNARFDQPEGLACDGRDPDNLILYVAERNSHVIRQIELTTGRVSTLAGTAYRGLVKDGIGLEAGFNTPQGIVFDPSDGSLYVTDLAENVIRRIQ